MLFSRTGTYSVHTEEPALNILAVGDIVPGGRTEAFFMDCRTQELLGNTWQLFSESDFVLFNLEAPLTKGGIPIRKCGSNFRVSPDVARGLFKGGFKIASLANNHMLDYGPEGIQDTKTALNDAQIYWHGAGKNSQEANKPIKLVKNGIRLTLLNYAEGEFSKTIGNAAGAARIDLSSNKEAIKCARQDADFIIVSVHAGKEFQHFPSPWIQDLYRRYISFGADVIIGHHPHIPQGIEHYKGGIIAYSLGDFMFEYKNDPGTCATFAIDIVFGKKSIHSIKIIPMRKKENGIMTLLESKKKQAFINHINRLSAPLGDAFEMKKLHSQGIIRHFNRFYYPKLKEKILDIQTNTADSEEAGKFLYNMFDCPSHREALKLAFEMKYTNTFKEEPVVQNYLSELFHDLEKIGFQTAVEPYSAKKNFPQRIKAYIKKKLIKSRT